MDIRPDNLPETSTVNVEINPRRRGFIWKFRRIIPQAGILWLKVFGVMAEGSGRVPWALPARRVSAVLESLLAETGSELAAPQAPSAYGTRQWRHSSSCAASHYPRGSLIPSHMPASPAASTLPPKFPLNYRRAIPFPLHPSHFWSDTMVVHPASHALDSPRSVIVSPALRRHLRQINHLGRLTPRPRRFFYGFNYSRLSGALSAASAPAADCVKARFFENGPQQNQ
jgi:hypothetical protein